MDLRIEFFSKENIEGLKYTNYYLPTDKNTSNAIVILIL